MAVPRTIVAILENHQQKDGSVKVPKALIPFLGMDTLVPCVSVLKTITGRRPKLIGTDLDGTIVANYGFISERTKIAFTAANAAGIHIYFVTGRPIRWMAEIKENFNFGLGICGNGAMLYDFLNEKILEQWLFSVEAQLETVKRLRAVIPPVTFAVEVNQQFAS